jgi:glycosyltransferase involved in cell wall biosynthesis
LWRGNRAFGVEAVGVVRAIERARCDVVHANVNLSLFSSRFLFALARLLRAKKIPLVATLHGRDGGDLGRRFKVWRMHAALAHADVVVHSDAHAHELAAIDARLPRPLRRTADVHVVAHGLPPLVRAPIDEAKRALGIDPSQPVIAHFGFLVPDKGVLETIRALGAARRAGRRIAYVVSGAVYEKDPSSRAYLDRCRAEAIAQGIVDDVRFETDFATDAVVLARLHAADWIVLNYATGSAQGTSGAVTRALASGRPVAVTRAHVFDEVRGATVTSTSGGDVAALARELVAWVDDRALAEGTMARAAALLEARSWPAIAHTHRAIYERLLARR